MIQSEHGFFILTPPEFAAQCEAANLVPRLCTVQEAHAEGASGLRAWPSGLLPWGNDGHVLAWSDGRCMVSQAIWAAMGGVLE